MSPLHGFDTAIEADGAIIFVGASNVPGNIRLLIREDDRDDSMALINSAEANALILALQSHLLRILSLDRLPSAQ